MAKKSCNSVSTQKGCSDNSSYAEVKSAQEKMITLLDNTETILDNFSSSLSVFCEAEQENLIQIDNKLSTVVDINKECCDAINLALSRLITVIVNIDICDNLCLLDGIIECDVIPTTTEEVTTTEQATTEPVTTEEITTTEITTTEENGTTVEPTTTIEPTTTEFIIEFFARYFNTETTANETHLLDTSGNHRDLLLTRINCVLGDGTAKLTFTNLPTYDSLTIIEDGIGTPKTLTANELILDNGKTYNYAVFKNVDNEVAKFPLMEHDSDYDIDVVINFYDVIGIANCVLTNGSSDNISKADGLSWNFEHGFAVEIGYNTQHPKMESGIGYGGITDETITETRAWSVNANQYVQAPDDDTDFVDRDTDNQFYSAGVPFNLNLADIYDNDYITVTKDADVITDLKIELLI
jgi:hypothetical protein